MNPIVSETHVFELNLPHDIAQRHRAVGILILGPLPHYFLRPLESRQCLGELGSDGNDLHDRRNQKTQQQSIGNKSANRQSA